MGKTNARIDEWKRKLIDLSRRNRLLFFRPARSSSLKVIEPSLDEVFLRLAVDERSWKFFIPPEENPEQDERTGDPTLPLGEDIEEGLWRLPESSRRPDELVCRAREARKLRTVLRNLHRRSRSDFEERGVRILHLVFGILEWQETQQSEQVRSPLLLVPAQIVRASANDPFELCSAEEDIILNPAIAVKLWNDFRVQLPSTPDDWEETTMGEYLADVAKRVRPQGWSISPECWIGLFSFHKLVIYQDLNSHAELIKNHPIVRALADDADITTVGNGDPPDPNDLDTLVNPKESYLVVDADSSQLACIEAVKRGANLVIQGPPGTGKSQTICNLIAESIAGGRTVLFMSEKMAALEVVYKRLLDAKLGHYCLELHSHKANKRQVVGELYRCYLESLQPRTMMTELEFQRLTSRTRQLNDYVNALHLIREPLGRSAYDVLGDLAELEKIPFIPPGYVRPETLTPARLDEAVRLAQRLSRVWKVVFEGERYPWRGCTVASYGVETRTTFQAVIRNSEEALTKLSEEGQRVADALGLPAPTCLADAIWLLQTGEILREGPGIKVDWLAAPAVDPFISKAEGYSDLSSHHRALKEELGQRYTDAFFQLPATLKDELRGSLDAISSFLGREVYHEALVVSQRDTILRWVRAFMDRLDDWEREVGKICNILGLPPEHNIEGLRRLVRIAELCESTDRPDRKWFDPLHLEMVHEALPKLRRDYEARATTRKQILEEYEESFLSLDLERFVEAFSTRYASSLRWLKPGFYRLRREIRRRRRDHKNPAAILDDLNRALGLVRLEAKIDAESRRASELLGALYHGYDTNFERAENGILVASELLKLTGGVVSEELVHQACLGLFPSTELQVAARRLGESLTSWEEETSFLARLILPLDRLPTTRLPFRQSRMEDLLTWAKRLAEPLEVAVTCLDTIESSLFSRAERPPVEILADLDRLAVLRDLECQVLREADRLQEMYGDRFRGLDTNWDDVLAAVAWARELKEHLGTQPMPDRLLRVAHTGAEAAPGINPLRECIEHLQAALRRLVDQFGPPNEWARPEFVLRSTFDTLTQQLREMQSRVDEIRDWVDYRSVEADFRQVSLHKLYGGIVQRPDLRPEELSDIVRRALLNAWIDWLFRQEPALGGFRGQDHEALIAEFRELDRKHARLGAHRVIAQAEGRRPRDLVLQPGGEVGALIREANKKKRHLPIRHLFAQMPNLLTSLKPCLLMGPLSVSQFLDPQQIRFDLVIFDEASQICSEDAVGAIYRGQQLIVCGDNRQLPPTAFFEQGMSDEFEDQDAAESFDVFDSILDECVSIARMPQCWLRWHYRSRHESLIAFSNRRFYDDRLVTFPASRQAHPSLGIQFVHVPEGVYDRGGKRDNPREAEIVVGLVIQHFLRHPTRSLGVVAFSVAQMNAIEDRLEVLLRRRPELERYFTADRLEGFFVKNLENVQGDERDVIIFSIGYGRDQQGRLTMNFGP